MKCEICGKETQQTKICNECKSKIFEEKKEIPCEICGKITDKEICPQCAAKIEAYKIKKAEQQKTQIRQQPQQSAKPIQPVLPVQQTQQPIIIQVPQNGNQITCTKCGSSNISTQTERRHKKSIILSIVSFLLFLIIGAIAIFCIVAPKPTEEEALSTYERGIERLDKERAEKALTFNPMSSKEYTQKKETLETKKNEDMQIAKFASTSAIIFPIVAGLFLILFIFSVSRKETITFEICRNCNQKQ